MSGATKIEWTDASETNSQVTHENKSLRSSNVSEQMPRLWEKTRIGFRCVFPMF
jgi:hypothetical protein